MTEKEAEFEKIIELVSKEHFTISDGKTAMHSPPPELMKGVAKLYLKRFYEVAKAQILKEFLSDDDLIFIQEHLPACGLGGLPQDKITNKIQTELSHRREKEGKRLEKSPLKK